MIVIRHGKAIVKISPLELLESDPSFWKKPALRLIAKSKNLSSAILSERELL